MAFSSHNPNNLSIEDWKIKFREIATQYGARVEDQGFIRGLVAFIPIDDKHSVEILSNGSNPCNDGTGNYNHNGVQVGIVVNGWQHKGVSKDFSSIEAGFLGASKSIKSILRKKGFLYNNIERGELHSW